MYPFLYESRDTGTNKEWSGVISLTKSREEDSSLIEILKSCPSCGLFANVHLPVCAKALVDNNRNAKPSNIFFTLQTLYKLRLKVKIEIK